MTPSPAPLRKLLIDVALITLLAVILRTLAAYYFFGWQGLQLLDLSRDAIQYHILGLALLAGDWQFANPLFAVRPPLMPLWVAGLYALFGANVWVIAIGNLVIGSITAGVVYLAAWQTTRHRQIALIAGAIVAADLASIAHNLNAQAETLANFFLALMVWALMALWQTQRLRFAFVSGLCLAAAVLVRPNGLYLFLAILPLFGLFFRQRWWLAYALFALLPIAVWLGWSVRNQVHLGVYTYSTVSDFNLLFYRAVSVVRWAEGGRPDADIRTELALELDARLGLAVDPNNVDAGYFWNNFIPDSPERLHTMRQMALEIYAQYPHWYLLTTVPGMIRMFAYTDAYGAWWWPELLWHGWFYGAALVGAWVAFRRRDWPFLLTQLLLIAYFVGVTLISQTTGMDTRMRTLITAPLALLAALGIWTSWPIIRQRVRPLMPVSTRYKPPAEKPASKPFRLLARHYKAAPPP